MILELVKEGNLFYIHGSKIEHTHPPDVELSSKFSVDDGVVKIHVHPLGAKKSGLLNGIYSFLILEDGSYKNKRLSTSADVNGVMILTNIK